MDSCKETELPPPTRPCYVAIEGVIGVGKTTLALLLQRSIDAHLILEVFEENPFLAKFYTDRARYAFQTQMFFLLSRYRQHQQVPAMLGRKTLITDYIFAKDWLFAQLNLVGDEWDMYERIHAALAEQVYTPDLVVYLQADTEVLMGRIAQRDRPYERDMDREYIESLRRAYEQFFSVYEGAPVLAIDTNQLNFVAVPDDFRAVAGRIRSALETGAFQQSLPLLSELPADQGLPKGRPLSDWQRFHVELDAAKHFDTDLYFNYLCLSEEMGELGSELAKTWLAETRLIAEGETSDQARQLALERFRDTLESELADCMAYLLKLANYAEIDLESAYLNKMDRNRNRSWRDSPKAEGEEP
jgi:deoxyadenosine/deoxycytidine kinase/NTP pyrophosphatase (non-canonical NTP hydrolase)